MQSFDKRKLQKMQPMKSKNLVVGDVEIDDDERAILSLNLKFTIMSRLLDENTERYIEIGITKMRIDRKEKKRKNQKNK